MEINTAVAALSESYSTEKIAQNPHIAATRQADKALGKSLHGYPSSDSRRAMIQPGRHEIATIIYSFEAVVQLFQRIRTESLAKAWAP